MPGSRRDSPMQHAALPPLYGPGMTCPLSAVGLGTRSDARIFHGQGLGFSLRGRARGCPYAGQPLSFLPRLGGPEASAGAPMLTRVLPDGVCIGVAPARLHQHTMLSGLTLDPSGSCPLICAAGLSPAQASVRSILEVNLAGAAAVDPPGSGQRRGRRRRAGRSDSPAACAQWRVIPAGVAAGPGTRAAPHAAPPSSRRGFRARRTAGLRAVGRRAEAASRRRADPGASAVPESVGCGRGRDPGSVTGPSFGSGLERAWRQRSWR